MGVGSKKNAKSVSHSSDLITAVTRSWAAVRFVGVSSVSFFLFYFALCLTCGTILSAPTIRFFWVSRLIFWFWTRLLTSAAPFISWIRFGCLSVELGEGDSRRCEASGLFRTRVRDLSVYSSSWIHGSEVFEFFACILNLLCCFSHLSVDLEEAIGVD